ncbi:hypothetical protein Ahy_A03g015275 isoform B [Arachis hypogaea]|uniref:Uncharacterized protein n=1 Tax=Arachis hypogaea TaxID=3818 RepID=A0A445E010_ARAHY|nr:hypothetical protein Ahy_A03g015275 isoform B [Arachis hypogaea]
MVLNPNYMYPSAMPPCGSNDRYRSGRFLQCFPAGCPSTTARHLAKDLTRWHAGVCTEQQCLHIKDLQCH